jgi:hypothetical protein
MDAKLCLLDIYNEFLAKGGGATELASDKGHSNCEARQGSFVIGLVQYACLWQEAHGEIYFCTRLDFWAERNGTLSPIQYGLRK